MARILIVEDEERISSFIAKGLKADGYVTSTVADGAQGLDYALTGDFDLVILDINLPSMNGFEVLEQMRASGSDLPVIVLTARDSVTDTVSALEGGADDYMPKPFRFAELLARVRLRLRTSQTPGEMVQDRIDVGGVRLDLRTRQADVDGERVDLSAREFALAEIFMLNPGQVLSREQLLDHVWGFDFDPGTKVLEVYIGYLRRKLDDGEGSDATIETVRNVGYRLRA